MKVKNKRVFFDNKDFADLVELVKFKIEITRVVQKQLEANSFYIDEHYLLAMVEDTFSDYVAMHLNLLKRRKLL